MKLLFVILLLSFCLSAIAQDCSDGDNMFLLQCEERRAGMLLAKAKSEDQASALNLKTAQVLNVASNPINSTMIDHTVTLELVDPAGNTIYGTFLVVDNLANSTQKMETFVFSDSRPSQDTEDEEYWLNFI